MVVGVDGSRAAAQAVMWALDEAVDRDIPLLLVYALDDTDDVAAAESKIRGAISAVESTGKPARLEAEIVRRPPATALLEASRSAAMVCVGSIGFKHASRGRIGSTAAALAVSAHCPVAVVPRRARPEPDGTGLVLAVVDGSSGSDAVLEQGVAEARLRSAPLRVFTLQDTRRGGPDDPGPALDRRVAAELENRVARWRADQPDLDVESVRDHNGLLNYLEHLLRAATPVQLIVVDPQRPGPADVLLGPPGRTALEASGCTLMFCDRRCWL
ncbi:hypothetical protein AWC28_10020 [Mycolicibacter terrae]|nr:hypothetical protein AWC28_10020 [Mycolicibacter terrae]